MQIKRNIQAIKQRIKGANSEVQESLLNAYARSLLHYFATPMRAANIWRDKDIIRIESQLYRDIHSIPRDIKSSVILNVTQHLEPAAAKINKKAMVIANAITN